MLREGRAQNHLEKSGSPPSANRSGRRGRSILSSGTIPLCLGRVQRPHSFRQSWKVDSQPLMRTGGKSQRSSRARHQCSSIRPQWRNASHGEWCSDSHPRSSIAFIVACKCTMRRAGCQPTSNSVKTAEARREVQRQRPPLLHRIHRRLQGETCTEMPGIQRYWSVRRARVSGAAPTTPPPPSPSPSPAK